MREIFDKLTSLSYWRVIDVGCGDCQLAAELLAPRFEEIHLLDVDDEAIKAAMLMKHKHQWNGRILRYAMEDFDLSHQYSCIVLRYTIGYLRRNNVKKFL